MWKEAYKIGDAQMDQQNKHLFEVLGELLQAAKAGEQECREECKRIVAFVKDYTRVHFDTEEMLQSRIGFPEMQAHKKQHDGFCADLREMEFELMRTDYSRDTTYALANMLTKWWVFHVVKEDRKLAAYLVPKAQGG